MTGQGRSPVTLSAAEGSHKLGGTTAAQSIALLEISSSKDLKQQNHKSGLASQKYSAIEKILTYIDAWQNLILSQFIIYKEIIYVQKSINHRCNLFHRILLRDS